MTRKDYVALAEALHDAGAHATQANLWEECVRRVGDVLAADNPRFDRNRFENACAYGVRKVGK